MHCEGACFWVEEAIVIMQEYPCEQDQIPAALKAYLWCLRRVMNGDASDATPVVHAPHLSMFHPSLSISIHPSSPPVIDVICK